MVFLSCYQSRVYCQRTFEVAWGCGAVGRGARRVVSGQEDHISLIKWSPLNIESKLKKPVKSDLRLLHRPREPDGRSPAGEGGAVGGAELSLARRVSAPTPGRWLRAPGPFSLSSRADPLTCRSVVLTTVFR